MNSTTNNKVNSVLIAESAVEAMSAVIYAVVKVMQLGWVLLTALYTLAEPQLQKAGSSKVVTGVKTQLKRGLAKVRSKLQIEGEESVVEYLDPAAVD